MKYSVAIRTLGTSKETLKRELVSLHNQTVRPEKIMVYIAEGYPIPDFRVGMEEYVYVKKGMIAQRALQYKEIDSEYILLLDDDVELAPDSAERLLHQLRESKGNCMAADTFQNHAMSWADKVRAVVGGWVYPRFGQKWAFTLNKAGSFSYINNPCKDYYPSQSAAGPASLWRKESLLAIHIEDEIWLDELAFAFGEDELEFYKLHINCGGLYVSFNNGIRNLDGKAASGSFQKDEKKYHYRVLGTTVRWHRMHISPQTAWYKQIYCGSCYSVKLLWIGLIHTALSMATCNWRIIKYYVSGINDAVNYIASEEYRNLPCYRMYGK